MHQILYCMRFKGRAVPGRDDPATTVIETAGDSCTITTSIDSEGMRCALQPLIGGHAYLTSQATMTAPDAFREQGSIRFGGDENTLRFVSIADGHFADSPAARPRTGAVTWRVEGGDGQFAGAYGLITSNFTLDGQDVTDFQVGVIFVPAAPGS